MDIAITGSSGLIGTALTDHLKAEGHRPVALVRRDPRPGADEIRFQPSEGVIDAASLEGIHGVVNLAGAGIGAKRWNEAYKKTVLESRTSSTTLVAEALAGLDRPPSAFLSGSAIGIYGDRGSEVLTEESPRGPGFLGDVVQAWEAAAAPAVEAGIRTVYLRTGIVMDRHEGALAKFLPLFRFGLGGKMGDGTQFMSWIGLADEVRAIVHLLTSEVSGPVNLTGPEPVTNLTFTKVLAKQVNRPALLPVPEFGPKLLLGSEMADALLFDSARVEPTVLLADGFEFAHPTLAAALAAALA